MKHNFQREMIASPGVIDWGAMHVFFFSSAKREALPPKPTAKSIPTKSSYPESVGKRSFGYSVGGVLLLGSLGVQRETFVFQLFLFAP